MLHECVCDDFSKLKKISDGAQRKLVRVEESTKQEEKQLLALRDELGEHAWPAIAARLALTHPVRTACSVEQQWQGLVALAQQRRWPMRPPTAALPQRPSRWSG